MHPKGSPKEGEDEQLSKATKKWQVCIKIITCGFVSLYCRLMFAWCFCIVAAGEKRERETVEGILKVSGQLTL